MDNKWLRLFVLLAGFFTIFVSIRTTINNKGLEAQYGSTLTKQSDAIARQQAALEKQQQALLVQAAVIEGLGLVNDDLTQRLQRCGSAAD